MALRFTSLEISVLRGLTGDCVGNMAVGLDKVNSLHLVNKGPVQRLVQGTGFGILAGVSTGSIGLFVS